MKDRHTKYVTGEMNHWESEVYRWQYKGRGTHFDMQLVMLYSKADNTNRGHIAKGFPELAKAFKDWEHATGVFSRAHLELVGGE